jgi:hypothetical protein
MKRVYVQVSHDDGIIVFACTNKAVKVVDKPLPEDVKPVKLAVRDIHRLYDHIADKEYADKENGVYSPAAKVQREWLSEANWPKLLKCYIEHYGLYFKRPLRQATYAFLEEHTGGGFNNALYAAACDMKNNGMSKDEILAALNSMTCPAFSGRLDSVDLRAVESAWERATNVAEYQKPSGLVGKIRLEAKALSKARLRERVEERRRALESMTEEERNTVRGSGEEKYSKAHAAVLIRLPEEMDKVLLGYDGDIDELVDVDVSALLNRGGER